MNRLGLLLFFALLAHNGLGQITQTIRGKVVDAVTQRGLPGASLVVVDSAKFQGAATEMCSVKTSTQKPEPSKRNTNWDFCRWSIIV